MTDPEQEFIFNHSKRAEFEMCQACSEYLDLDTDFDYDDESDESEEGDENDEGDESDEDDESGDTLRSARQPSSSRVSLEEAMDLVRDGSYCLLASNRCHCGNPCLSAKGDALYKRLKEEEFDCNPKVVLMEVLRRLGHEKATGEYTAFALGLVEKRYVRYVDHFDVDGHAYVRDKLMEHLDMFGVITKEEYSALQKEHHSNLLEDKVWCHGAV
ncbi:hypothetical protein ACEPAI_4515 [Sanghuangporus weigelae]